MDLPECGKESNGLTLRGIHNLQAVLSKAGSRAEGKRMRETLAGRGELPRGESRADFLEWLKPPSSTLGVLSLKEKFDWNFVERTSILVAYTPAVSGRKNASVVVNGKISADEFSVTVHGIAPPEIEKHGVENSQYLMVKAPQARLQRDGVLHLRQYTIEVDAVDDKRNSLMLLWKMREAIDKSEDMAFDQSLSEQLNRESVRKAAEMWAGDGLAKNKCTENPALRIIFSYGIMSDSKRDMVSGSLRTAVGKASGGLAKFVLRECIAAVGKITQTQKELSKLVGRGKIMKLTLPEPGTVSNYIEVMCPSTYIAFRNGKGELYIVEKDSEGIIKYRRNWHNEAEPAEPEVIAKMITEGFEVQVKGHEALCLAIEDLHTLKWARVPDVEMKDATLDVEIRLLETSDQGTQYIRKRGRRRKNDGPSWTKKAAGVIATGVGAGAGAASVYNAWSHATEYWNKQTQENKDKSIYAMVTAALINPYTVPLGIAAVGASYGAWWLYNQADKNGGNVSTEAIPNETNQKDYAFQWLVHENNRWKGLKMSSREVPRIEEQQKVIEDMTTEYCPEGESKKAEFKTNLNNHIVYSVLYEVLTKNTFANMVNEHSNAHVPAGQCDGLIPDILDHTKAEFESWKGSSNSSTGAEAQKVEVQKSEAKKQSEFGVSHLVIGVL